MGIHSLFIKSSSALLVDLSPINENGAKSANKLAIASLTDVASWLKRAITNVFERLPREVIYTLCSNSLANNFSCLDKPFKAFLFPCTIKYSIDKK